MSDYLELMSRLNEKLSEHGYVEEENITIPDVLHIAYVKDKPLFKVRNLCVLLNLPANIAELKMAKRFFDFIRKSVLDKYGEAFLWKELEIVYIILCENHLFDLLKEDDGKAVDQSGFKLNTMLGSCFVNKQDYQTFGHSNWGLYFSGKHFKEIDRTVKDWCLTKGKIQQR